MLFGFTLATCIWERYATDSSFRGTPRGSRKKPIAGRSPTGHLSTFAMCRGLEKNGMVGAGHGRGMASVNQTRPHCVNQMGETHSKPLAARHGRGTAWARHAMCESAFTEHGRGTQRCDVKLRVVNTWLFEGNCNRPDLICSYLWRFKFFGVGGGELCMVYI
jgi:hypothetical protein